MCGSKPGTDCNKSRDPKPILTPARRLEIEQLANRFGPPNCWTGTSVTLAAVIRELLNIID